MYLVYEQRGGWAIHGSNCVCPSGVAGVEKLLELMVDEFRGGTFVIILQLSEGQNETEWIWVAVVVLVWMMDTCAVGFNKG